MTGRGSAPCSGKSAVLLAGLPAMHHLTTRANLSRQGNATVLNSPHGVIAPAPLMLCVPVTPGM